MANFQRQLSDCLNATAFHRTFIGGRLNSCCPREPDVLVGRLLRWRSHQPQSRNSFLKVFSRICNGLTGKMNQNSIPIVEKTSCHQAVPLWFCSNPDMCPEDKKLKKETKKRSRPRQTNLNAKARIFGFNCKFWRIRSISHVRPLPKYFSSLLASGCLSFSVSTVE